MTSEPGGGQEGDGRHFYRVSVRIPLRCRPLAEGEFDSVQREIHTPRPQSDELEPALAGWLRRIEQKLDLVLSHHDPALPVPLGPRDARDVVISGSGLRLVMKPAPEVESDVLLEFELPGPVTHQVRAIGRVVRTIEPHAPEEEPEVAIRFRSIAESDREAIVRFAHEAQRVELRARAQSGAAE